MHPFHRLVTLLGSNRPQSTILCVSLESAEDECVRASASFLSLYGRTR